MLKILIENSKNKKWVEKEVQEFNDMGITKLGDMLKYWLEHFKSAKYPVSKFKLFVKNFSETTNKIN